MYPAGAGNVRPQDWGVPTQLGIGVSELETIKEKEATKKPIKPIETREIVPSSRGIIDWPSQ